MRTIVTAISAMFFAAILAAASPDRTIPFAKNDKEWVSATLLRDDGSGIVVVAGNQPRHGRFVLFDAAGRSRTVTLEGMSVNAIAPVGEGSRYFISGAVGTGDEAGYYARLVDIRNDRIETIWDSSVLGAALSRAEPVLEIDRTGRQWAVLTRKGNSGFTLRTGSPSSKHGGRKTDINFQSHGTPGPLPPRFAADAIDVEFVDSNPADPTVAVLHRGRVYLVSMTSGGIRAVLQPPRGGNVLRWDAPAQTLWVEASAEWSSFDLRELLAKGGRANAPRQPDAVTTFAGRARHAVQGFPLGNGRFALQTRENGAVALELFDGPASEGRSLLLPEVASDGGLVYVSPAGKAALLLPQGVFSNRAIVKPLQ
ncbi:MAG TPA: hypothetical protein VGF69_00250 [Thermoanaerobaculia bacterium]|jgi:hypothetical protein